MPNSAQNKIAFCWQCMDPLTRGCLAFCDNDVCFPLWKKNHPEIGAYAQYFYLNKSMLDLARGEGIPVIAQSAFIHTGHDMVGVAAFPPHMLQEIPDAECNTYDAYYRIIEVLDDNQTNLEPHNPEQMRREGMLGYLSNHFGITTERKIAQAIPSLMKIEGHSTPVDLINSL